MIETLGRKLLVGDVIEGEVKKVHTTNQAKCIKCEACLNNCPFKAIVKE